MASYRITLRHQLTGHVQEHTRKRIDAAKLVFERMVWEGLRANALLDTRFAHETMNYAENWEQGQGLACGGSYVACYWRVA